MLFVFVAISLCLFITMVQLSLHICPRAIREELQRLGSIVACCASADSLLEIGICPCWVGVSSSTSGRVTGGPVKGLMLFKQCTSCKQK